VLLDGCQALPVALEEWLRDAIICPLIKAGPPLVFIISGRQNQAHQRTVSLENGNSITVKGYADRLPDPAPVLWPLGPLSDPDIADLLVRAGLPSEPYLVDIVQSRSAGVPFAAQLVIHALQKMGAEFVREQYFLLDSSGYPFDQIVILVTRSFLDNWLENTDSLQQLRGLALVRPMDEAGLRAVWGLPEGSSLSDALANLSRRSSFIEPGGRMLPVAREFIRQELRIKDPRGARRLGKLAGDALIPAWRQVSSESATLAERVAMPGWRKCVLEMLNNLCWSNEQDALQFLAARVIESLLFDAGFAMQLVNSTQEFNHPADWFSARGQRVLACLRMAAAREAGMKNNYDFLLEKCEELGLNNQHRAILHILLAQDPLPPDPANYMLRNLLIAEGQLVTGSDPSLQQVLAYGFAELGWQPGQEGAATRPESAVKLPPQDGANPVNPTLQPSVMPAGEAGVSDLEGLIKLALYYYGSNKFDEAKETYERAIQLDAANVKCWNGLGAVYNALNRMDEAIAAYQKAIELDPVFVAPWIGLGALFNDLKDSERAISAYKRALALDPGSAIPWNGLGNVYHATHENEAAIAAFKKAIELDPRFAHAWNGLGYVYRHENRLEEAIAAFNKAVELHPLFALPWTGLGFVYRSQSNNEQAMMAYKKAIEISPRSAIPWNGLGYIYRDLRRLDDALAAFSKAVEFDPQYAAAWNGLGNIYSALRRREEALDACLKAVQIDPNKASYLNGLANAYREMGEIEQAMSACQRAIALDPKYAQPWYALGAMHGMLGQSDPAAAAFNKAIESEPGWAYPWNGLGNVYFNQAKFDEAFAAYLKATELDPNFAAAWSGLGSIHAQRGEDEQAVSAYRKALSLAPGDAALRQALSAALKRLGREDDVASLQGSG
jgi:tetratricopeptide (TPR) repeat protein